MPHAPSCSDRISRLVGLSSTTSTRRPASRSWDGAGASAAVARRSASGTVNQNVLPSPGLALDADRAAHRSTSCGEIARPRPVPPYRRVVEASACENGSNSRSRSSGAMPIAGVGDLEPDHARRRRCGPRAGRGPRPRPRSVNFTALPTRLSSTWRSRAGSPRSRAAAPASSRRAAPGPCRWAGSATSSATSSTTWTEVEVDRLQLELAGLDLREVEDVVDDRRAGRRRRRGRPRRTAAGARRGRCRAAARSCR